MASTSVKKPCAKCDKGGGVATCDGCQQSLCTKHFIEHRQELSQQIDKIGQEHDLLRLDVSQESGTHPLLSRIDQWERESITKIQVAAEAARADLHQSIDQVKHELNISVTTMSSELQSSRESDDFTEVDLKRWIDQLNELREKVETPSFVDLVDDNRTSSAIRLIKTEIQQSLLPSARPHQPFTQPVQTGQQAIELAGERFSETVEGLTLSEDGVLATCARPIFVPRTVCGANSYSSGTHHIRLLIEEKGGRDLFFGIMVSSRAIPQLTFLTSVTGWWDLDNPVVNGHSQTGRDEKTLAMGDEVTLILHCDDRQIQLQHHRTNRIVDMSIDVQLYPLPWKVLLKLASVGDRVRILN